MQNIKETIYKMMMTSTGTHMLDSGGNGGRHWQRNQANYPTITDIENSSVIDVEQPEQWYTLKKGGVFVRRFSSESEAREYIKNDVRGYTIEKETLNSTDVYFTISLYHYLTQALELDATCEAFNALPCKEWNSDKAYGISVEQEKWLESHGLMIGDTWNSYNHDSNLSQVIQGANVMVDGDALKYPTYVLLQVHQGADVRGGYTDAKLFKIAGEYFTANPTVYGDIDGVPVSTAYDGNTLLSDGDEMPQGEPVPVTPNSVISLYLAEY